MFDMKQIGKRIAELRKNKNMTQMELADNLGISFQAVSNWERGNTMPDISKLPELAEIFQVSVDELLMNEAPLVGAVLNNTVDSYIEEGKITAAEMADTLPLLKPAQADELFDKVDMTTFPDISSLLPFMNSEALTTLAKEFTEQGKPIIDFLPFMNSSSVHEFANNAIEKGESIREYLPFLNSSSVHELANKALGKGESIRDYLPFLNSSSVHELANKVLEKGESINDFLPFMNSDDIKELTLRILHNKK